MFFLQKSLLLKDKILYPVYLFICDILGVPAYIWFFWDWYFWCLAPLSNISVTSWLHYWCTTPEYPSQIIDLLKLTDAPYHMNLNRTHLVVLNVICIGWKGNPTTVWTRILPLFNSNGRQYHVSRTTHLINLKLIYEMTETNGKVFPLLKPHNIWWG